MKLTHVTKTEAWCIALASVFLAGVVFMEGSVIAHEDAYAQAQEHYRSESLRYQEVVGKLDRDARLAKNEAEWNSVQKRANELPPQFEATKKHFARIAHVRIVEEASRKRDRLLANAGELLSVNENDPQAKVRIAQAKLLHEEVEKLLKQIESDPQNAEWNLALEYRKAFEGYRSLAFVEKDEHAKALDILAGSIANLGKALTYAPKDNRTERAIEFLYKRAKEEDSKVSKSGQGAGRPRALPPPGRGNNDPGSGGTDRPRVH